jgi:hypothetical protein
MRKLTRLTGFGAMSMMMVLAAGCGRSKPPAGQHDGGDGGGAAGAGDATTDVKDGGTAPGDLAPADTGDASGAETGADARDVAGDAGGPDTNGGADTVTDTRPEAPPLKVDGPWLVRDVGDVGMLPGSLAAGSTAFTVRGAGAGIGGTTDAFFFAYQKMAGDGEIVARVKSLLKTSGTAEVGIMVRADEVNPGAPYVFLSLSGTVAEGGHLRSRLTAGGPSASVPDATLKEGRLLRLARTGKVVTAYRDDGAGGWTQVGVIEVVLPDEIAVGVAISDGAAATVAAAELDQARVSNLDADPATKGWLLRELGTMGSSAIVSGGVLTVAGLGERLVPTSDVGVLVQQAASGSRTISAKVTEISGARPDTRVGLMIREGTPDAPSAAPTYAMMSLTLGQGAQFQNRSRPAIGAQAGAGMSGVVAPFWLKLEKLDDITGNMSTFTGFLSTDGKSWNVLDSLTFPLQQPYSIGVFLLASSGSTFAGTRLSDLSVTSPK